jgi:hypothetical protein
MAHLPVDIPDFVEQELSTGDSLEVIRVRLQSMNWLSTDLVTEITSLLPTTGDVNPLTGERDKERFAENCLLLFPTGRVFASEKQIDQVADMFMDGWACKKCHDGKKIMCHYGVSFKKKKELVVDALVPREISQSQKERCQCPFTIRYSHQGKKVSVKKPGLFYLAKITHVNPVHTCGMCPRDMRIAAKRTGQLVVNIAGMRDILSLLSAKPRVACQVLRPMVENYVPGWTGIPAKYIQNFRKRVLLFLIKNPNYEHLTYEQAVNLSSKKSMAADEMTELDDPFVLQNFTAMLRKIMQEDSGTWEALGLMDQLKISSPGFDYRIKKDLGGKPTGIMYMTAQMRTHARRYGNVLCLDAQKRQYNSSGWPYIAPCVKDNEMKVAVAAESIVTEENHEYYVWILMCMVDIEPRFQLSDIRIIFADQKITPTVLHDLGIEASCTLRGDFYHLLHEVWPNHFHSSVYPQIQKFLRTMLLSSNKVEWDSAYSCARDLLLTKPKQMSSLDDIYGDPEKYAGYYLRSIEGNLHMNGDVSAEQNHSGVVAYLGEGACFAVAEQITHLLNRQKNLDRIRRQTEDDQFVSGLRFASSYYGPAQQADDAEAKKNLSGYGFTKLWTRTIKNSWKIQSETGPDNECILWPTNETPQERSEETTTVIKEGCRCMCSRRIAFMIQCEHEYVMDGGLDLFKYDTRWFHRQTFDKLYPQMASVFAAVELEQTDYLDTNGTILENQEYDNDSQFPAAGDDSSEPGLIGDQIDPDDEIEVINDPDDLVDGGNKENFVARVGPTGDTVTYQHIMEKCSELARTCQNDQSKMRTLLANLHTMKERVRDGHEIFVHFDGNLNLPEDTSARNNDQPRNAVSRAVPNATGVKRKMSGREYNSTQGREFNSRHQRSYRKTVALSQLTNSNDDSFLPPPNVKSRSCRICKQKGHGQGKCPYITKFGTTPLEKNNESVRQKLQKNLSILTTYELQMRQPDDSRTILTELPALKDIKGLVIHRRFLGNRSLYNPYTPENICLECTVLHLLGIEHPSFTKQLFNVDCISAYIIRNKINIIMCQLQESSGAQYPTHLSQQTYQQPTQDGLALAVEQPTLGGHVNQIQIQPFSQLTQNTEPMITGLDAPESHI